MATKPVLLDLQAHELLLGERLTEKLLQPDRIHAAFHREFRVDAEIVAGPPDGSASPRAASVFRK
jgi:hypothetical protein